ncbi:MBL fold metallo-hydrolase [Aestuariibaculum suncheonense]|uniref:MBL fold metallo-hydrolase n=2 Tax=Aestuariibaculum suncheonense TaxID=1028745 RepID=A0A8J6UKX5_9FLAO|nr:MBL fold metallo-hydrolase [Aestuariibaculum suncheonense]MBD0836056.1 MBL fold metallo-hydrolase [Aestuariibaculum suncheonense]
MDDSVKITFLGASGTVTGSKFFIETSEKNILVDCGMFQGLKELRLQNWDDLPIDVSAVDVILLTHGHFDHVGYLPRLLKQGFQGKIIGTAPTLSIAEIVLLDSAKIHEEDAEKANKENYTKHYPALPFYNKQDVERIIRKFQVDMPNKWIFLSDNISYRFQCNGHILGSTFIEIDISGKRFVFSGDVGRIHDYLLESPKKPEWADFLFIESTYGDKLHPKTDVEIELAEIINDTIHNQGNLIIPSFAVERLQTLIFILWKLYQQNKIPNIPIFVDSPMGTNVLKVFKQYTNWHKLSDAEYDAMCHHVNIIQSYKETWETIDDNRSKIIIAGSGMVTGGRVLTYLQQLIDQRSTTILLVGFQAEGTRGRLLKESAHEIRFYGKYYPVKAKVKSIESLSAHADQYELLDWMNNIMNVPEKVYLIHGEPNALDAFRLKIKNTYGWNATIPKLFDVEHIKL